MSASSKTRPNLARTPVPRRLQQSSTTFPYVILGAGCSGLSLAWNLVEMGVTDPILLVDRRVRFANDRTWCFWDVEPTPFSDLATHSWKRWRIHDGDDEVVRGATDLPYLRLRAIDVYRRILDRLADAPNVTVALGRPILSVREGRRGVTVATPDREYLAGRVFDSSRLAMKPPSAQRGVCLLQHFVGQTIRANRPVFDPSCPTLMDFRTDQGDGPHFVYVLPLSRTEGLVENTYLYPFEPGTPRHRREIADYLRVRHGLGRDDYTVTEEESGAIPMAVGTDPSREGSRISPIGLAGGAARPSSGYAFLRIQRQAKRFASAIAAGEDMPIGPLASRKYDLLDSIFLKVLADRPALVPGIFGRMFAGSDPSSVVRFLSETSSLADDLKIVASLPKWPFLAAAAGTASAWRPGISHHANGDQRT